VTPLEAFGFIEVIGDKTSFLVNGPDKNQAAIAP
jgi:hypothetical protein